MWMNPILIRFVELPDEPLFASFYIIKFSTLKGFSVLCNRCIWQGVQRFYWTLFDFMWMNPILIRFVELPDEPLFASFYIIKFSTLKGFSVSCNRCIWQGVQRFYWTTVWFHVNKSDFNLIWRVTRWTVVCVVYQIIKFLRSCVFLVEKWFLL